MRKMMITSVAAAMFAIAGAAFWPTAKPDVAQFGDSAYETIWVWRIPAYANNPSWRVRWSWTDPLRAQARCCRALPTGFAPHENAPLLLSVRDIHV